MNIVVTRLPGQSYVDYVNNLVRVRQTTKLWRLRLIITTILKMNPGLQVKF
jgi:hypothetical protein